MTRIASFLALPAILSLLLLGAAPSEAQSVNARNLLKLARSWAQQGDWEQAKSYAEKCLKEEPGYIDAIYMRAFAHRELKEYSKAEADFREVIRLDPAFLGTYGALAQIYLSQEQYDKAEKVFVELGNQPKGAPWASYYRGVVAYLKGDLIKAERLWQDVISLDPNFTMAQHNLGALYLAQGKYPRALGFFREASEQDKENATYRFHTAWALEKTGQREACQELLKKIMNENGDDLQFSLLARALDRLLRKNPKEALKTLEGLGKDHPENLDVWILTGRAHLMNGDTEAARTALEKAKELDAKFLETQELLAKLPAKQPEPEPETKETPETEPEKVEPPKVEEEKSETDKVEAETFTPVEPEPDLEDSE